MNKNRHTIGLVVALFAGLAFSASAVTTNLTVGGDTDLANKHSGGSYLIEATVDFTEHSTFSTNDVLQVLTVPAGVFVENVGYSVETVEDNTLTFDVGDGSDTDGYIDGADGETLGYGISAFAVQAATNATVVGYTSGKLYTAADTIDVLLNNDADTGKIVIKAWCIDLDD